jgi:hypothetical protein
MSAVQFSEVAPFFCLNFEQKAELTRYLFGGFFNGRVLYPLRFYSMRGFERIRSGSAKKNPPICHDGMVKLTGGSSS